MKVRPKDQRKAHRLAVELPIQLNAGKHVWCVHTLDISDSGVYIALDSRDSSAIHVGDEVTVQLIGTNYLTPILACKVVRKTPEGVALKLLKTITTGDASGKSTLPDQDDQEVMAASNL